MNTLIISHLGLKRDDLHGETIIVTGGGGGIGYEAANVLLWLGANVIIAEINEPIGKHAAEVLSEEFDPTFLTFLCMILYYQEDKQHEPDNRKYIIQAGKNR